MYDQRMFGRQILVYTNISSYSTVRGQKASLIGWCSEKERNNQPNIVKPKRWSNNLYDFSDPTHPLSNPLSEPTETCPLRITMIIMIKSVWIPKNIELHYIVTIISI